MIVVMKKHGSNTENISHAVLRLGTKLWWLRAPLTLLHASSGIEPRTLVSRTQRSNHKATETTSETGNSVGTPWKELKILRVF